MAEHQTLERRRTARASGKFLVKFKVVGGPAPKDIGDRIGQVRDLSPRGLQILAKRPLPAGTLVEVKVPANPLGPARTLRGAIRWSSEPDDAGDVRLGVESAPEPAARAEERRRFPRRAEKLLLRLRCESKGLFHELADRGGILVDLSKGGVELTTTREYPPGSILRLQFPESPLGPARVVYARVAWGRPSEKPGHSVLGAAFVRLSEPPPDEGI